MNDVATAAANSIIRESVLGALLLLAVVGLYLLMRRLLSVQDQRVADQVRANELMERSREKTAALMEQVTTASIGTNNALDRLTDVQSDQVRAIAELRSSQQSIQTTIDSVIREAVRSRVEGPGQGSSGRHEGSRPGAYSHSETGGRDDRGRR